MANEPQLIHWAVDDGRAPGIQIDKPEPGYVPWSEMTKEVEERLLPQALRVIPKDSTVITAEFHGREHHQILIVGPDGNTVGSLWFGKDPYERWRYDGLVRIGKTLTDHDHVVWQIFQRFSDGTYRRVEALDRETRPARVGFV